MSIVVDLRIQREMEEEKGQKRRRKKKSKKKQFRYRAKKHEITYKIC